jgi:hypothetical protein
MAKKIDSSLSLDYILAKQQEEKLSGLSSSVAAQVQAAGAGTVGSAPQAADTAMISELKSINNNITKMASALLQNTSLLKTLVKGIKGPQAVTPKPNTSPGTVSEDQLENENYEDKQIGLLTKIEKNTKPQPKVDTKDVFGNLGGLAAALALAIGGLIGVVSAQVKLIRNFVKFLVNLIPENVLAKIKNGFKAIGNFFEDIFASTKAKIAPIFEGVTKFFEESLTKFKSFFDFGADSKVVKVFEGIKTFLGNFIKPFEEAFEVIKSLVSGPVSKIGGFFEGIGKWFGMFAKSIGKVAIIVEKIAYPIMIIMAVWDTVKGFIEGFKKDGIIGGIKGALTGLFDSVVGGLLDMIKGAISWIAGALGFKNVEKWLDSFSFEGMFKKLIDTMFKPIEMIRDMFTKLGKWVTNLEIPGIGFKAFGHEFKFGPWHPFASDKSEDTPAPDAASHSTSTSSEPLAAQPNTATPEQVSQQSSTAPQIAPAPPVASDAVYAKSAENATMGYAAPKAPQNNIVNAPTTVVKQTSNNLVRTSLRNEDPSIRSYFRSRYAY